MSVKELAGTVVNEVAGVYLSCPGCSQMKRGYYDCPCGYDSYRRAEQGITAPVQLPSALTPLLSRKDIFLLELAKKTMSRGFTPSKETAYLVREFVDTLLSSPEEED
ncbi:MAG: hypothetical protein Q8P59_07085 [Dehalococcoidia bacterium]|nr:hypothetical protein [Dehalococcoidia bacterium]